MQIVDQIAQILDPDRQPDERIANPECFALLFRNRCVGHERRMIDQAFDPAQTLCQRKQMRVLEKATCSGQDRFSKQCVTIPPNRAHLGAGEIMLRMRFQSRVMDGFDLRLFFQPARDLQRIRTVSFHA